MARLIEVTAAGTPVVVAVTTGEGDVAPVGLDDAVEKVESSLRENFEVIARIAEDFVAAVSATASKVTGAELEFSLEMSGKGTIYVVETTGKATFKVKLTLKL
jgi:C4-dicarboxylate transporter